MWLSPDGQVNTVALPDPVSAMQDDFVDSLVDVGRDGRRNLISLVEDAQEQFFDLLDDVEPSAPTSPEHDGLPANFLHGSFGSAQEIASYVDEIDVRWQLDALMDIEDFLEELDENEARSWFGRRRRRLT